MGGMRGETELHSRLASSQVSPMGAAPRLVENVPPCLYRYGMPFEFAFACLLLACLPQIQK